MSQPSAIRPPQHHLNEEQIRLALAFGIFALIVGLFQYVMLWFPDGNGFSLVSHKLPYWDFTNLWAGSHMVLDGKLDFLFDTTAYRGEMDRLFGANLLPQEWSYPPSLLLIGVPLATLPIWLAYAIWSAGTLFCWHLAVRQFHLPRIPHLFVVLSPAAMSNLLYGQNDALMAALLIGGLVLAPKRPIVAGILFGLLTVKPHLGLLVPFCLLASWNFRAIVSAGVTAAGLIVLTGFAFGFDVWVQFVQVTRPLMVSVMEFPYPHPYQTHATTAFVFLRSLGADLDLAYAGQALVVLTTIALAFNLWRPGNQLDHGTRVALTGVLVIAATPYGYTYDTLPIYLALVWFLYRLESPSVLFLGFMWLYSILFPSAHFFGFSAGFFGPAILTVWLLMRLSQETNKGSLPELRAS